ncbi:MAG: hypothetical protein HKN44_04625 [Ilumatobacter sp.]|nr:hypothetical protein [Ilumatobacter sp.]
MAIPTFVGVTEGRNGDPEGSGSLTLTVPAGAAGDLLVAVVGVKVNPSTSTPAGWTPIIAGFNGCVSASDPQIGIRAQLSSWWKISDGSETSVTVSFGAGVTRQAAGGVLRYSGADSANPIDAFGCDKGTSTGPTAPTVTTTTADDRVLRLVASDADDAQSLFTTEPATKRFELASTSVFGPGSSYTGDAVVVAASDAGQAAAGASGTAAWALPSADQWAAQTVAIRSAGGGGNGDAQEGCLAAIVAIIRKIIEAIIAAINKAIKALVAWIKRKRAGRSSGS